jgi:hypothetical protein
MICFTTVLEKVNYSRVSGEYGGDMVRPGNNPKRRIAPITRLNELERSELAKSIRYEGSGHHKRSPADYGLERTSPRPHKSLCDGFRTITLKEAKTLIEQGTICGMFSDFFIGNHPKFIWSVGPDGEAYEARTDDMTLGTYHGYPLEEGDAMSSVVKEIWKTR